MLGALSQYSQDFLFWLVVVTSLLFALPIFLVPLRWARLMGWTIPEHTHLAIYFGRCLGAFILIVEALMLRAALTGEALRVAFEVLGAVALMMVLVHVHGALRRIQPLSETLEILMYAGMFLLVLLFWPG